MDLSNRERSILGHLVFEVGITIYYLWHAFRLPAETLLSSKQWVGLVVSIIPIAIFGGILTGAIVSITKSKLPAADERDLGIEGKAMGLAYRVMVAAIVLYVGMLGLGYGILPDLLNVMDKQAIVFAITPLSVLNTMIAIMLVAETVKYISQLWFYRRGY